jgi:hypothetical protein
MTGFSLDNLGNSFIEYDESIRGGLRSWMRRGVPEIFRYCETYLATARCQRVLGSAAVFSNHVGAAGETKGGHCGCATEIGKVWEQVAWLHV